MFYFPYKLYTKLMENYKKNPSYQGEQEISMHNFDDIAMADYKFSSSPWLFLENAEIFPGPFKTISQDFKVTFF